VGTLGGSAASGNGVAPRADNGGVEELAGELCLNCQTASYKVNKTALRHMRLST